jgi:hypothetical protein
LTAVLCLIGALAFGCITEVLNARSEDANERSRGDLQSSLTDANARVAEVKRSNLQLEQALKSVLDSATKTETIVQNVPIQAVAAARTSATPGSVGTAYFNGRKLNQGTYEIIGEDGQPIILFGGEVVKYNIFLIDGTPPEAHFVIHAGGYRLSLGEEHRGEFYIPRQSSGAPLSIESDAFRGGWELSAIIIKPSRRP